MITHAVDGNGHLKRDPADVMHIFTDHMMKRYAHIPTDDRQMKELVQYGMNKIPSAAIAVLDAPIMIDELVNAVRKRKTRTSLGQDGICKEFYRTMWDTIKQDML